MVAPVELEYIPKGQAVYPVDAAFDPVFEKDPIGTFTHVVTPDNELNCPAEHGTADVAPVILT